MQMVDMTGRSPNIANSGPMGSTGLETLFDMKPFRTISVMVNSKCNLRCMHCDLPRKYDRYHQELRAEQWEQLLESLIDKVQPLSVTVSAMEPLLPDGSQEKTAIILKVAKRRGLKVGFVTNGMFAAEFFSSGLPPDSIDYLDISMDGPPRINDLIRGPQHRPAVESFLASKLADRFTDRLFISTTLSSWNLNPSAIREHFDWVRQWANPARIVLLLIHPNQHVDSRLPLAHSRLKPLLECLLAESAQCEEIFMDIFPSSLPDLASLIERGILPGAGAVAQDETGILWGHVGENLFVRYNNRLLLDRYHLRVSPEGHALRPEGVESQDYLSASVGNLLVEPLTAVLGRLESRRHESIANPQPRCRGRDCLCVCAGENLRCVIPRL